MQMKQEIDEGLELAFLSPRLLLLNVKSKCKKVFKTVSHLLKKGPERFGPLKIYFFV